MSLQQKLCHSVVDLLNACQGKVITEEFDSSKYPEQRIIKGELVIQLGHGPKMVPSKAVSVRLYSATQVDPTTGKGKLSEEAKCLKHGKRNKNEIGGTHTMTYKLEFDVESDFGVPGAFAIKNKHKFKFFLQSMDLQVRHNQIIHFACNSWIYPFRITNKDRLFFSNTCFLPSKTPNGLARLRKEELANLRGDGTGKRREWDRIYDYDLYNDLGDPSKGPVYERPTLGGSDLYPYPRRLRTGRPPSTHASNLFSVSDFRPENLRRLLDLDVYVPPDERISPRRLSELVSHIVQAAVQFVIPEVMFKEESSHFQSFDEIKALYEGDRGKAAGEWVMKKLKGLVPDNLFKLIKHAIKETPEKLPLPQLVAGTEFAWKDDQEFGRQMLAGSNPTLIQCLQRFPLKSKTGVQSSIQQTHLERNLYGLTLEEAINQQRIFILDHHDYLMPFLSRINKKGICAYASRTLFFLKTDATLKPMAIELSLPSSSPGKEITQVFYPETEGTEAALWQLAKAHVAANDSGYNQLTNHWLKSHAIVEPFIIATRRNLSTMHPIHRLLNHHFKDTMHINALARKAAINSGGILEKTLYTGKFSMEVSSMLYKDWRLDQQGLPADLVQRHMAMHNPDQPARVQLLFEDYPYGADGLEIWVAIKRWVTDFCSYFYKGDDCVTSDNEIQEWWSELQNVGHGDKSGETWWVSMTTLSDLIEALTTVIWIVSAFHSLVKSGQYGHAGYPSYYPTLCRAFIPKEGTKEFAKFLSDPDMYYLKMLPHRFEMTLAIAFAEVLSRHTKDEVYLGQQPSQNWIDDDWIYQRFKQFASELNEVGKRIKERNRDPKLKNRWSPMRIPYEALYPGKLDTETRGGTGNRIPASILI